MRKIKHFHTSILLPSLFRWKYISRLSVALAWFSVFFRIERITTDSCILIVMANSSSTSFVLHDAWSILFPRCNISIACDSCTDCRYTWPYNEFFTSCNVMFSIFKWKRKRDDFVEIGSFLFFLQWWLKYWI